MRKLWTDDILMQQVILSTSFSDLAEKLGIKKSSNSVRKRIKELNLDTSHWFRKTSKPKTHKFNLEEILIENSPYTYTSNLKKILIKNGIMLEKCYECGITHWNEKPIALQLHHINGKSNDNRVINLTILCPNCHSQTETYSGRNTSNTRKAKTVVRYKCSHCEKLSTNNKFITCRSCMIKYHLGPFKSKFNEEQVRFIINQHALKISIYRIAKELKSSEDAVIKVLKDNLIIG